MGVGGSATTDGGLGAITALGWKLPAGVPVVVACDASSHSFMSAKRCLSAWYEASGRPNE